MFTTQTTGEYNQALSLWPVGTADRGLNIVLNAGVIANTIISVCLTKKGENPLHPNFGLAPELFDPLTSVEPTYLAFHLRQELETWVKGVSALDVQVSGMNNAQNRIEIAVRFQPRGVLGHHLLTFPFHQYLGALFNGATREFLASLSLDQQPFAGLL